MHGEPGGQTVDRRGDLGVRQGQLRSAHRGFRGLHARVRQLRLGQCGVDLRGDRRALLEFSLGLLDVRLGCLTLILRFGYTSASLGNIRLGRLIRSACGVDLGPRDVALRSQLFGPLVIERRFSRVGFRSSEPRASLAHRGGGGVRSFFGALHRCLSGDEAALRVRTRHCHVRVGISGLSLRGSQIALRLRHFHLRFGRIDVGDRVAAMDELILVNVDVRNLPGDPRGDRHHVRGDLRVVSRHFP